jgi:hypothetical protein
MTADPDARKRGERRNRGRIENRRAAPRRALFFSLPSLLASRRPDIEFPIFSGEAEKLAYRAR